MKGLKKACLLAGLSVLRKVLTMVGMMGGWSVGSVVVLMAEPKASE